MITVRGRQKWLSYKRHLLYYFLSPHVDSCIIFHQLSSRAVKSGLTWTSERPEVHLQQTIFHLGALEAVSQQVPLPEVALPVLVALLQHLCLAMPFMHSLT